MRIRGKSVRSLEKVIAAARGAKVIRFVTPVADVLGDRLDEVGFELPLRSGDTVLPSVVGKATEFNSNGRIVVRRDLPMESHEVSYFSTWKDWHGYSHSGIKYHDVKRYPRETIPAPSEQLQIIDVGTSLLVSTRSLDIESEDDSSLLHLANMMLECWGGFDVLDDATGTLVARSNRYLNWQIFPPGKYPWSKAKPIVEGMTKGLSDALRPVVEDRLQTIAKYEPDFMARGRAGFGGYLVFGFSKKSIFVLESAELGNATYVFNEDWEDLSKLTKAEVIEGHLAKERIIHGRKWKVAINILLR